MAVSGSDRAPPALDIRLFGAFEVRRDGNPLPHLRSLKGSRLLALLALRHGGTVERAWVAGTLWPDSPEVPALANLRNSGCGRVRQPGDRRGKAGALEPPESD